MDRILQQSGDQDALEQLLAHAEPLAKSILEYRNTTRYESIDELLGRIRVKIWRSIKLYDPQKGSAFSFCARIISSTAASVVGEVWMRNERFCQFDESTESAVPADPLETAEKLADIAHRVRMLRTPCTAIHELKAQQWLVSSFLDCGFFIKRFQAANAMTQVFGLDYVRSRWLFDMTLVAIRRQLIDGDRRVNSRSPRRAWRRTKSEALIRFARFLSAGEFTKLATLMRDIPPNIILSVDPSRSCAVRKGEPAPTRANLLLVLNGSATERRLFG